MKVLIVEDDPLVCQFVDHVLVGAGYEVSVERTAAGGLKAAESGEYGAIILDVNLPGGSGFNITEQLRSDGVLTPIIMLTARNSEQDLVRGLDAGADDYITKPALAEVILARLRAVTRRREGRTADALSFGDLEMKLVSQSATCAGQEVALTPNEARLLAALLSWRGGIATRADLYEEAWGLETDPGTSLLSVHVTHLRNKLQEAGSRVLVETERGIGYRLVDPGA